jgi:hypothetical protein
MTQSRRSPGDEVNILGNRIVDRGRGCWNCIHFDNDKLSRTRWFDARQRDLATAVAAAAKHAEGENHPDVKTLRQMIFTADKAIARGQMGVCLAGGVETDFVEAAHLCGKWTGRQGASLATHGHKLDKLPQELQAEFDAALPDVKKEPSDG